MLTEREISELQLLKIIIERKFDIRDIRRRSNNHKGKQVYVGLAKEVLKHSFESICYVNDMKYPGVRSAYNRYKDLAYLPNIERTLNSIIEQFEDERHGYYRDNYNGTGSQETTA